MNSKAAETADVAELEEEEWPEAVPDLEEEWPDALPDLEEEEWPEVVPDLEEEGPEVAVPDLEEEREPADSVANFDEVSVAFER